MCVYSGFQCDGENDCGDMSDENHCGNFGNVYCEIQVGQQQMLTALVLLSLYYFSSFFFFYYCLIVCLFVFILFVIYLKLIKLAKEYRRAFLVFPK